MTWWLSIVTSFNSTNDIPIGLGRNVERVANTPILSLPPKRGGRTKGFQPHPLFGEKQIKPKYD